MDLTAELQILAEIMGGLESTGITGLLWYLGYGMLKYLIGAAIVIVFLWLLFKFFSQVVSNQRDTHRTLAIASAVGIETTLYLNSSEYKRVMDAIEDLKAYRSRYEEQKARITDYQGRLGVLGEQYETLYSQHEEAKKQRDLYQEALLKAECEAIKAAKGGHK